MRSAQCRHKLLLCHASLGCALVLGATRGRCRSPPRRVLRPKGPRPLPRLPLSPKKSTPAIRAPVRGHPPEAFGQRRWCRWASREPSGASSLKCRRVHGRLLPASRTRRPCLSLSLLRGLPPGSPRSGPPFAYLREPLRDLRLSCVSGRRLAPPLKKKIPDAEDVRLCDRRPCGHAGREPAYVVPLSAEVGHDFAVIFASSPRHLGRPQFPHVLDHECAKPPDVLVSCVRRRAQGRRHKAHRRHWLFHHPPP